MNKTLMTVTGLFAAAAVAAVPSLASASTGGAAPSFGTGSVPHASHSEASASVTGASGYYWATGFDNGTPTATVSAQFYTEPESVPDGGDGLDHSITEIWYQDKAGNAVEVGVDVDDDWANGQPFIFTDSWSKGKFNGYDDFGPSGNGFVSTDSSIVPYVTEPAMDKWSKYEFHYSSAYGELWVLFDGNTIGYYPSSFFPGGWGSASETQTYGEVYNGGGTLPTMNGGVQDYSDGSNTLGDYGVSSPYEFTSKSPTEFTFKGPE
jgi:hypothetical protein